jgi:hypothetical protein
MYDKNTSVKWNCEGRIQYKSRAIFIENKALDNLKRNSKKLGDTTYCFTN